MNIETWLRLGFVSWSEQYGTASNSSIARPSKRPWVRVTMMFVREISRTADAIFYHKETPDNSFTSASDVTQTMLSPYTSLSPKYKDNFLHW